jgi:2-polyprenyl-6-methoxyphenol hydroxylase-like FAD-dependent oxidoreductase
MTTTIDVLVVGAGPSGLTTAAEVARTGASVVVVEKRAISPVPRAGTLLPRPLELFDSRGIAGRFIRRTSHFNPHPFQPSHIWAGMSPVDWTARPSRFGFTLFLNQHETELTLREWAEELGCAVHYEHELTGLEQDDNRVVATVRDASGTERTFEAKYVVGADGGKSRTRQAAGIEFPGHDATFTGIVATAHIPFPWPGGIKVGHNERGWLSSFPFGEGQTRFTLVHAEARKRSQADPVTAQEFADCVSDILGEKVDIPDDTVPMRYGDARRLASMLQKGRVFLVGEAARLHYPASGVGMNFCIQDAFNLGWKLGAVLAGDASPALLETYETERLPIVNDLLESVDSQVAIQFNFTPEGLAFWHNFSDNFLTQPDVTAKIWDELLGLETPYATAVGEEPGVGKPFPDVELLLRDGTSVRVYELLQTNPFVVLDLTGFETIKAAELDGLPAVVVAGQPASPPAGLEGAKAVLVRPDTYVAWTSAESPEPGNARAAVLRALGREAEPMA